jgi:cytidine deaminase
MMSNNNTNKNGNNNSSSRNNSYTSREVLIYNVTHSDLMLGVDDVLTTPTTTTTSSTSNNSSSHSNSTTPTITVRPRFSSYQTLATILHYAGYSGLPTTAKLYMDLISDPTTPRGFGGTPNHPAIIPIGFDISNTITSTDTTIPWSSLHLRASAQLPSNNNSSPIPTTAKVRYVYIPLAAQLIPAWKNRIESFGERAEKIVLLVCGAGRPQNPFEKMEGNSTRDVAELIAIFLQRFHGLENIQVVDSGFDVFSMDENVMFVRNHLLPRIEAIRRQACLDDPKGLWRGAMEVTLALTEGSPARLAALSAALRPYRPFVAHMWQLKTFWHEQRLLASDVLFHSFDRVDTTPPMPVSDLNEVVRGVVAEMKRYKSEFERYEKSELNSFWLRKSKKPVLSVLCVQKEKSSTRRFFRGINLEVSQPTGSLCSERNAIGSALAEDPSLKRRDLLMIAVLALPSVDQPLQQQQQPFPSIPTDPSSLSLGLNNNSSNGNTTSTTSGEASNSPKCPGGIKRQRSESVKAAPPMMIPLGNDVLNPLGPCGACNEWLKKIFEVNPDFRILTFVDETCNYVFVREVY